MDAVQHEVGVDHAGENEAPFGCERGEQRDEIDLSGQREERRHRARGDMGAQPLPDPQRSFRRLGRGSQPQALPHLPPQDRLLRCPPPGHRSSAPGYPVTSARVIAAGVRQVTFQRVIGSGAFGTVYLAELAGPRDFRRTVAVKVLLPGHNDNDLFVSRVRDEARLLGLLHDEHILKVLELVRVGERDAVVMEFVEGVDLAGLLAPGQRPPPRALAELGAAVAGALHAAHTAVHPTTGEPLNVVHRDVKPSNVMVSDRGGIKLLDFGVAQARFDARESRTGQFVLGTLNYMAPEYVITGEVSPAADVYGLALTLWEAAVGEVFGQPKLKEDSHAKRLVQRLEQLPPAHAELAAVLRPMLAWEPVARPAAKVVEQQLLAAADRLAGIGLRSWADAHVPPAMQKQQREAKDLVGLAGQTVPVADPSAGVEAPAEEFTMLNASPPPFLSGGRSVLPDAPPRAAAAPRPPRPARRSGNAALVTVVVQGLVVGGLFGLALVVLLGVYLFVTRAGG